MAAARLTADEHQRRVLGLRQQGVLLAVAEQRAGYCLGEHVGLEYDVAISLEVFLAELCAEEGTGQAVTAGQGQAIGQANIGAAQQAVADPIGILLAQWVDEARSPAGMVQAEAPGVHGQRQLAEPAKKIMPVSRILGERGECLVDQLCVARRMLANICVATAGWFRGGPAQGFGLVVAHDQMGLAGLDHVVDDMQRLADEWAADMCAAVDSIAEEHGLALR
ncbi:hypothetical protein CONLIGDRAFT_685953 [Coniochaeta ligniaria NRRL 30616]|uniref:Uncharacterized protein n=1 Tax=Coniochaeta ligniaria NRRL 30616 TaxID=1408157 RepID=A0A1J7J9W8_9PEZI|nr:hypothetical protein CONLIGDRAFT_685953 [Coniochaeta ligniaria NRRL 30616]